MGHILQAQLTTVHHGQDHKLQVEGCDRGLRINQWMKDTSLWCYLLPHREDIIPIGAYVSSVNLQSQNICFVVD
jgi:hypothetical protein